MAKQRHTSFGRRADSAADSLVEAEKARSPAAERAKRYRESKKQRHAPVTLPSQNVTQNVTESSRFVTRDASRSVTPSEVMRLYGLIHSLELRISSMEAWAEQMEERLPRMRVAATPLQGTTTSVPASPRIVRPGDTVRLPTGQTVRVPTLDADGQPIPE